MSDLISRRELIKHFEAIQQEENVIGLEFIAMIDEIKGQPTAYSVDKVVEELYEKRTEILLSNDYECEIINYCIDNFDKAIEIVKAGGENE